MIVTSRTRGGLPVSRLQMHDELFEIAMAGLRFDAREAGSFLREVAGLDLRDDDVTELWSTTDGWVAALQLVCVSLRGTKTPSELIGHISGRHHAIGDFLAENVLGALEPSMLGFMLKISLTEQICGGLATALTGEPRGQAMLEEIEARDLFLTRIDESGDWFLFHSLFAEFLRRRLERDEPQLITPLHRRASEWFAEHHMLDDAVDHALAAGDTERAVELVDAGGQTFIEHSEMTALLGTIDKLPAGAADSNPRVQLLVAWANLLVHRTAHAEAALERVRVALESLPESDGTLRLRLEADVADGCIRGIADHVDGLDDLAARIAENAGIRNPFHVSTAYNIRALSAIFRFDFEEAHDCQRQAEVSHRKNAGPIAVMYGHCLDGLAYLEQLDLTHAEQCFRAGLRVSAETGTSPHAQGALLSSALLAEVLYERGELAEAERLLDESFAVGADQGNVDMIRARHLIGVRLALHHDDKRAATEYLDDAYDIAERLDLPRLRAFTENEQVVQGLTSRRGARSRVTFDDREPPTSGIGAVVAQLDAETAIRLTLRGNDTEPVDAARLDEVCVWAQEWVDRLASAGRPRALLRAQRLLAVCLSAAGREEEARDQAIIVLTQCALTGLVRYPLDGGAEFRHLVEDIRAGIRTRANTAPLWAKYLDEVLDGA